MAMSYYRKQILGSKKTASNNRDEIIRLSIGLRHVRNETVTSDHKRSCQTLTGIQITH